MGMLWSGLLLCLPEGGGALLAAVWWAGSRGFLLMLVFLKIVEGWVTLTSACWLIYPSPGVPQEHPCQKRGPHYWSDNLNIRPRPNSRHQLLDFWPGQAGVRHVVLIDQPIEVGHLWFWLGCRTWLDCSHVQALLGRVAQRARPGR